MSSRVKLAIGAVVVVAVVLGWFFLFFSPAGDKLDDLDTDLSEAQSEEAALTSQLDSLRRLEAEAPAREAALRRLNAAVPEQPDLDVFILEANEIAGLAGVDWLSVSPTPPAAGGAAGVSVISLSIEIQGGFFQVLDYINRLEGLERLVITDGLNISAGAGDTAAGTDPDAQVVDSGTGAPTLSVTLSSRMYTRASAAAGPGDPTAATPESPGTTAPNPGSTEPTTPPDTDAPVSTEPNADGAV